MNDILNKYDECRSESDSTCIFNLDNYIYTYKVGSKYGIEVKVSDNFNTKDQAIHHCMFAALSIIDLDTGSVLKLTQRNLPDFTLESKLLLEIERDAYRRNIPFNQGCENKYTWDKAPISLVRDFLTEVFGDMNKKEVISAGAHCCVCGALEEYAKPDKEGKVYCYLHCY